MSRPSALVLLVFAAVVLIGGTNWVGARFSNRELSPFWGAGLRFTIAGGLFVAVALWRGIPLPLGARFPAVATFGAVNFGLAYAFGYSALVHAPAAAGSATLALVPLLSLVLLVCGAVSVATGTILLKRLPRADPVGTNAVAMLSGAALLLLVGAALGERPALPHAPEVALAVLYIATVGSVGLFAGIVYVVRGWTASASSYTIVLTPPVVVVLGALIAGELVNPQFIAGAALMIVGTVIGALGGSPGLHPRAISA